MSQPAFLYKTYGTTAAVTASSTLSGTLGADILIPTEDTFHSPASTSAYNYVIDLGAAATVDYVAILGENLDGVSLEVRGSTDNFAASDVSLSAAANMSSDINAAWRTITSGSYRYFKFLITGHSTAIKVSHIAVNELVLLPYFSTDWDAENLDIEANNLVSSSGVFIGVNQQNAMRELSLDIGEVNATELADIKLWSDECIKVSNPFFFVPDTASTTVFYGWLDNPSFSAPYSNALYGVAQMTMKTRAA